MSAEAAVTGLVSSITFGVVLTICVVLLRCDVVVALFLIYSITIAVVFLGFPQYSDREEI